MAEQPETQGEERERVDRVPVSRAAIEAASHRISDHIRPTPLRSSPTLTAACGAPIFLKCETRQETGSFKLRGATNAVLALDSAARGLVTASTGNHGRALAHVGRAAGVRTVVCMSDLVPGNKVEAVRALGAEVRIVGRSQDAAQREVDRLVQDEIPPFDHPDVVAGQGTIVLEVAAAVPDLDLILVPLSGGGLAAGVAAAVKALRPAVRVVGISMARGAAMQASLAAGRPLEVEELESLADSLGGGIGLANRHTFAMCRDLLDGIVLLSEEEIVDGIAHAARREGETVEGAGAVGVAALLAGRITARGPTVAILSGRNIDPTRHAAIVAAWREPRLRAEVA